MLIPATRTAVVQGDDRCLRIDHDVPMPHPRANELLVQVHAVAINPCDHKMYERFPSPGTVDGCDFAGVVVALGCDVATFSVGDRVCGAVHGSNPSRPESGTFAQYTVSEAEFTLKLPPSMSFREAAGLGTTGLSTLGMAIYKGLMLPGTPMEPAERARVVLVHGASSSVGTMALQLLRLIGHVPIATCSPRNFALVRKYGAEEVFDYHDPDCGKKIKQYTRNTLAYVIDPFTDLKSVALCYEAMGRAGGRYACLEMYPDYALERRSIKLFFVMGMAILGHRLDLDYGYERDEDPELRAFGVRWYRDLQKLMDQGRLRPHPLRELEGGFEGILRGVEMLKNKEVSGQKLIVALEA
ncbi:Trans-enoyl reductase ccsC [Colletotrichum orbiculare MAFF 240422]|uniref:Trans-enoyl reductase ccsC n=1 Tax=Colletotrichum orbiculare (strain 104-T / ATCC 96160 / CBS 514.97 / LARS 414 / MAFF 240422) TaxID=1213857 RepID=N4W2H8_COLOR|nr:Trans-enoyl reductase ccsC [Colletotrichum orbiculare MAFF 240422]